MATPLGHTVTLAVPFDAAVQRTREALKSEGFGVLTEIDIKAAFREKLDRDFRPYVILGACNPPLAFQALTEDAAVGLLLPCNVTVEANAEGGSRVRLVDPVKLLGMSGPDTSAPMAAVAADAGARLRRVAEKLTAAGT
jgi:uncharacterized protein (DUF302 family)